MDSTRRIFLKISGLCALGLGVKPVVDALADGGADRFLEHPEARKAKNWGMVVDTRKCKEHCTDCIDACHIAHNVPDLGNPKDEVKWIWNEHYEHAFPGRHNEYLAEDVEHRPFMVLCNHCDNPPCVRLCPVQATFKRPDGIVAMDYHRCIGCRCCMAACPYGARSFNWKDPRPYVAEIDPEFPTRAKGVVEKCNFCAEKLAKGGGEDNKPYCVEACKEKALIFGDMNDPESEPRKILREHYTIRRKPELGTRPQVFYIV